MNYPYISIKFQRQSVSEFVEFWSSFIELGKSDNFYSSRINKQSFNRNDIDKFYTWKNGMKINTHKQKSACIKFIQNNLASVNRLKIKFDIIVFNSTFKNISAIWQIFLLHLIKPDNYPIFDQHVYRAHYFLLHHEIKEVPQSKKEILQYYHNIYLPFFLRLSKEVSSKRKIDQALVGLGQFLKTKYAPQLLAVVRASVRL